MTRQHLVDLLTDGQHRVEGGHCFLKNHPDTPTATVPVTMTVVSDQNWICGDTNADGDINLLDITYTIAYLYQGGPAPDPLERADVDGSGAVNIVDISYLIDYLYMNGPEPNCP